MSIGSSLLQLQELDLALERDQHSLKTMPELVELARKRRAYQKLKADATKLYAQRKDLETYLSELAGTQQDCEDDIRIAQRNVDSSDYRSVQQLETQLSDLAKQLEKIAFERNDYEKQLAEITSKQDYLDKYIAKFEASVVADTKTAREKAEKIQADIKKSEAQRDRLRASLPADVVSRYDAAAKQFRGLGVERLEGKIPSICRMTLQASSMADLKHQHDYAECPYCHRILVLDEDEQ